MNLSELLIFLHIALPLVVHGETQSVVVKGSHFFYANGSEFFIRGTYYRDTGSSTLNSSTFIDVLTDTSRCTRDMPYLVQLGLNTIGVFSVDDRFDHSQCMNMFAEAGIYVFVSLPGGSPNQAHVAYNGSKISSADYNLHNYYNAVVDEFQKYPNTLGFYVYSGDQASTGYRDITLFKSIIRDMKEYIGNKGHRSIPFGCAVSNHQISGLPSFMNCGDKSTSADFIILDRNFDEKTECPDAELWVKDDMIEEYRGFDIPSLFSFGCSVNMTKNFGEVSRIFSNKSLEVFSGGVADEWLGNWDGGADTGLVDLKGPRVIPRREYWALSSQLAKVHPSSIDMSQYIPTNAAPSCSTSESIELFDSHINATTMLSFATNLPSKPSRRLCSCMMETNRCIAGPEASALLDLQRSGPTLCSKLEENCLGVRKNMTLGRYGSYQTCNATERLSWIYNRYLDANNGSVTCQSIGGTVQETTEPAFQASDCKVLLKQAGVNGLGTVTYIPTSTVATGTRIGGKVGEGLSEGAKIGIGIGAAISLIFALAAIWSIYLRHLRRNRKINNSSDADAVHKPELEAISIPNGTPAEIDGREVGELGGDEIQEVDAHYQEVHELNQASLLVELDGVPSGIRSKAMQG